MAWRKPIGAGEKENEILDQPQKSSIIENISTIGSSMKRNIEMAESLHSHPHL